MTTRELRNMLFYVYNQELTVRELRKILLDIYEQDEELEECELSRLTARDTSDTRRI